MVYDGNFWGHRVARTASSNVYEVYMGFALVRGSGMDH